MSRVFLDSQRTMFKCDHEGCNKQLECWSVEAGDTGRFTQVVAALNAGWKVTIGAVEKCSCPKHKDQHQSICITNC